MDNLSRVSHHRSGLEQWPRVWHRNPRPCPLRMVVSPCSSGRPERQRVSTPSPRVGIVVRTKNRPWFLRRSLRDVSGQDFGDWRVHIVNDGGDAAVVETAVAELAPHFAERVSMSHNPAPTGRSAAANQGVRTLETEFVVLHDDDDLWHPSFLSTTVGHLAPWSGSSAPHQAATSAFCIASKASSSSASGRARRRTSTRRATTSASQERGTRRVLQA